MSARAAHHADHCRCLDCIFAGLESMAAQLPDAIQAARASNPDTNSLWNEGALDDLRDLCDAIGEAGQEEPSILFKKDGSLLCPKPVLRPGPRACP